MSTTVLALFLRKCATVGSPAVLAQCPLRKHQLLGRVERVMVPTLQALREGDFPAALQATQQLVSAGEGALRQVARRTGTVAEQREK